MIIEFGKYKGMSVELLIFRDPGYANWICNQPGRVGKLAEAKAHARKLARLFDRKPFVAECSGRNCKNIATRFSVFKDAHLNPVWWCNDCDPYSLCAGPGQLAVLSRFVRAIDHVEMYGGGKRATFKSLIREFGTAKGLPRRVGEKQAQEFFKSDEEWGPP
jgi:hypothetical protein